MQERALARFDELREIARLGIHHASYGRGPVARIATRIIQLGPDRDHWHLAEHLAHRLALRQIVLGHQVMPAGLHQMRNSFSVIRAACQAERQVTAEHAASRQRG